MRVAPFESMLASQLMVADWFARTAVAPDGAVGTPAGTIALDAEEAIEEPTAFAAVTVNVYETPLLKPVTTHDVVTDVHVNEPGVDVTTYELTGSPLSAAAVHETVAERSPRTAVTPVGAAGLVAGIATPETPTAPFPIALCAYTLKVYETPLVRPGTTHDVGLTFVTRVEHWKPPGVDVTV